MNCEIKTVILESQECIITLPSALIFSKLQQLLLESMKDCAISF